MLPTGEISVLGDCLTGEAPNMGVVWFGQGPCPIFLVRPCPTEKRGRRRRYSRCAKIMAITTWRLRTMSARHSCLVKRRAHPWFRSIALMPLI